MNLAAAFQPTISGLLIIIAAMVAVALIELLVPLHARGYWNRAHLKANLALTLLTFATNIFLNAGLLMLVMWLESKAFGLMRWLSLPPLAAGVCVVLALDFSFYAAHFSWHKVPWLWRFHAVHHSDPALDVTSTIRQHPVEGLLRYAVMGVMVIMLGPSPAAFTVYRVASALNALLEHANIRAPRWLDAALSLVTSWPHMHKVHHSRIPAQTDSNYGNLFSFWDRLFGTFTPTQQGTAISYGLEGMDDPASQTTRGLLAAPFRDAALSRAVLPAIHAERADGHAS
jgi:sterol desaturase/sphingolipid hydroxylase (fatty acid hydroxylase superfamily)